MRVEKTVAGLRALLDESRRQGKVVGAVPTMGALHEGHLSLVKQASARADEVVVTIFVNPTQFGPHEDFERYPRDLEQDSRLAEGAGATVIFAPPVEEMYPANERTRVRVSHLSEGLCGASRPGHFDGVATIVTKLFNVVGPGIYFFGRKDYQQLKVIERLARDLLLPVSVAGCPIVREPDGLAMSSRNRYLDQEQRKRALALSMGLKRALRSYKSGERDRERLRQCVTSRLHAADVQLDYVELCDPEDLSLSPERLEGPALLAVAAFVGSTRLIDNVVLDEEAVDSIPGDLS